MQYLRYVILFFATVFPFLSAAQLHRKNMDIQIGEKLRLSQRKGFHKIIGEDGAGIYAIQPRVEKGKEFSYAYSLQHFDEQMNLIKEAEISVADKEKKLQYKFIVQLNRQLYVFLTHRNKDSGEETLFAQEIDMQSLQTITEPVKVAAVSNKRNDGYFTHALSPDRSKLLITYARASGQKSLQEFNLYVLDATLVQLWSKEACLPYPDHLFTTEQYKVDDFGNVYLLSTLFEDKRSGKRNGKPNYKYHLVSYKNRGQAMEEYAIRLPDKFLTDMKIVVNSRQDIIGGGFYADQGSYEIEGSYFFTIDGSSNEIISNSVREFEKGLIHHTIPAAHLADNSRPSSTNIRQYGFSLNDMVLREDGSAVLVGEQFLVSSRTKIRKGLLGARTESRYYYDYTDLILVNAGSDGKINWTGKINKFQHSHDDAGRYSSYYLQLLQDNMYFVFNKPLEQGGQSKKDCKGPSETVMVKVDREGRQYHQKIEGLEGTDVQLMPGTGLTAGMTDLVFLGAGKRNARFIRMSIEPDDILTSRNE